MNKKEKNINFFLDKLNVIAPIVVLGIFLFISVKILIDSSPAVEDVPDYIELTSNPYAKYEKLISRADINELIKEKQIIEMTYDADLIEKKTPIKREDIFKNVLNRQ